MRPDELKERVRAATLDSVRAHLVADVEVGAFLSGGIDSGALLGLMRDAGNQDVKAFTVSLEGIRGAALDEVPAAARVARQYQARHVVREVSRREILDEIDAILDAMDQPSIDGVNMWLAAKAAAEAGLKVVIAGTGGDELLAGYASFRDVPAWHRRYGMIAAIPGVGQLSRTLIGLLAPGLVRRRPKAAGMLSHAGSWAGAYLLRRGLHLPHELGNILDADLAREGLRRLRPLSRLTEVLRPDPGSDVARVCALESAHYLRNQLLRDADWAGMAQGVEIRLPLVDAALLRQLAPVVHAMDRGAGKAALAQAPSLPLPPEVATRLKSGFSVPSGFWLDGGDPTSSAGGGASRSWSRVVMGSHQPTPIPRAA